MGLGIFQLPSLVYLIKNLCNLILATDDLMGLLLFGCKINYRLRPLRPTIVKSMQLTWADIQAIAPPPLRRSQRIGRGPSGEGGLSVMSIQALRR